MLGAMKEITLFTEKMAAAAQSILKRPLLLISLIVDPIQRGEDLKDILHAETVNWSPKITHLRAAAGRDEVCDVFGTFATNPVLRPEIHVNADYLNQHELALFLFEACKDWGKHNERAAAIIQYRDERRTDGEWYRYTGWEDVCRGAQLSGDNTALRPPPANHSMYSELIFGPWREPANADGSKSRGCLY